MFENKYVFCAAIKMCQDAPGNGALPGKCSECATSVWLAPSTQRLIASDREIRIVCLLCGPAVLARSAEPHIFAMAPGAAEEIMASKMNVHQN